MQNVVHPLERWAYSPAQKEQWRALVMGEWLVGVTLHLFDQVVTHLVPLGDHWRGVDWGISDCSGETF
jgi:hypothetical protein